MEDLGEGGNNSGAYFKNTYNRKKSENFGPFENGVYWRFLGSQIPKQEIVYFCQIVVVYTVILACIINLTWHKDEGKVWIALLSACLGYILPNPSLKHMPNTPTPQENDN